MKHCEGDAQKLEDNILTIVDHYKGNHTNCFPMARCRTDVNYIPTKVPITSPAAESALRQYLKGMPAYKKSDVYKYCMDTHYVESFNNALLQYVDKRIVFGKLAYVTRINMAILDWNENVDRGFTSQKHVIDAKNPRRNVVKNILKSKTTSFKDSILDRFTATFYQ